MLISQPKVNTQVYVGSHACVDRQLWMDKGLKISAVKYLWQNLTLSPSYYLIFSQSYDSFTSVKYNVKTHPQYNLFLKKVCKIFPSTVKTKKWKLSLNRTDRIDYKLWDLLWKKAITSHVYYYLWILEPVKIHRSERCLSLTLSCPPAGNQESRSRCRSPVC